MRTFALDVSDWMEQEAATYMRRELAARGLPSVASPDLSFSSYDRVTTPDLHRWVKQCCDRQISQVALAYRLGT